MKKFIEENLEKIKRDICKLVSFNTVLSDDEKPFGQETKLCLDEALKMMDENGFKTKNLDYYCGYGEVGEGDELIGIVAHLDVVPPGKGWESNPFEVIEKDGYLYGRGVSDDKGAAICAMYAIKYLLNTNYKFKKRVRLLLGCNEETGSKCMEHYNEVEEEFTYGFTPDGDFPGIYAEKGMVHGALVGPSKIKDIKGGDASNVVCKEVEARIDPKEYDVEALIKYFNKNNINYEIEGEKIIVHGVAAHASTPDLGVNAINHLFVGLKEAGFKDEYVDAFTKHIGNQLHGESLGFEEIRDEATNTSINMGVIKKENDLIVCSLDMRFAIKAHVKDVLDRLSKLNEGNIKFIVGSTCEPLYFDTNTPMIKALKKAYEDVTGDFESEMEAIGGGTYAKSVKNIIAFGCEFIGEDNHIHDVNEKVSIESLKKQIEIYVEAIKNLNEV